jgi:hypothetical protein
MTPAPVRCCKRIISEVLAESSEEAKAQRDVVLLDDPKTDAHVTFRIPCMIVLCGSQTKR